MILWSDLSQYKAISLDLETYDPNLKERGPGWATRDGYILGVAIGVLLHDGKIGAEYIPVRHSDGPNEKREAVLNWLSVQLSNPKLKVVGANLTYDLGWLAAEGVHTKCQLHDVQYAEALLDERAKVSLDALGMKYLGVGKESNELYEWCAARYGGKADGSQRANIYRAPLEMVWRYALGDAVLPLRLIELMTKALRSNGLWRVYRMECDLIPMMVAMRRAGVTVDLDKAQKLSVSLALKQEQLHKQLCTDVGFEVNINAASSIRKIFDVAKIEYTYTDKGNPSFSKEVLVETNHPWAQAVIDIRALDKLRTVFIDGYVLRGNVSGKVYPQFHQLRGDVGGTRSGRMSSSKPLNIQNIPSRGPLASEVRGIFVPDADHSRWVSLDYSQIEYRMLIHFAHGNPGDNVRQFFNANPDTDYHVLAQNLVKEKTGVWVDRKPIKNINFGLCIAENELVLTNNGLKPIQCVTVSDKVWDGVEWVSHDGVIYQGMQEVIEYGGLTATEEHSVWTEYGTLPFGRAARTMARLVKTGGNGAPINMAPSVYRSWQLDQTQSGETKPLSFFRKLQMQLLWKDRRDNPRQSRTWWARAQSEMLQKQKIPGCPRRVGEGTWREIRQYRTKMYTGHACIQPQLQRAGDKMFVQRSRTLHNLGLSDVAGRTVHGGGLRQDRQRRALYAGQFTRSWQIRESAEPRKKKVAVYDILNAGPRRRFTCSDVLVSNCYGMGVAKLGKSLGLDKKAATTLIEAYFSGMDFVKPTMQAAEKEAKKQGKTTTLLGRRSYFDLWVPVDYTPDAEALEYEEALDTYGPGLKRAHTHKALNRKLQGSAADVMKLSMLTCYKEGLFKDTGVPRITVHDELDFSDNGEARYKDIIEVMETCAEDLLVPLRVDAESGASWGNLEEMDLT